MERGQILKEYQGLMDWAYWFKEYCVRSAEYGEPLFSNHIVPSWIKISGPYFSGLEIKTIDKVMAEVASGEPLYSDFDLSNSYQPILYGKAVRGPYWHRSFEYEPKSSYSYLNDILHSAYYSLDELKENEDLEGLKKIDVVAIDFSSPKEILLKEIEALWLAGNGYYTEAHLVRLALAFNKQTRLVGPYASRAIGLWLWDFIRNRLANEEDTTQAEAIREMCSKYDLHDFGLQNYSDSDLRFLIRKTEALFSLRVDFA